MSKFRYIIPEWEHQSFVQLTWPHEGTDWAPILDEAEDNFLRIAREIARREGLLVVAPDTARLKQLFVRENICGDIRFVELETNDTWARDHGGISVSVVDEELRYNKVIDFCFNGWGLKFASDKDNLITSGLDEYEIFTDYDSVENRRDFVLEGGSIETDDFGTLLTTARCLMSPNRNATYSRRKIEERLRHDLGIERVLWLEHGALAGDDTDSHIDTLARIAPDGRTIIYQGCQDPADQHYEELGLMRQELEGFRTTDGQPYRLVELPLPRAQYDGGDRLPASYANYLVINGAVLVPTYSSPETDARAMQLIGACYPGREVVAIDCCTLVKQHGSLHCVTMQYY